MTPRVSRLAPSFLATLALALGTGGCAKGEQAFHPPPLLEASTPQFEPSVVGTLDAAAAVTSALGVSGTSVPARQEVPAGTVAVYPPPSPAQYSPSADEVAFAVTYARCGKVVGFGQVSARAETRARQTVEARDAAESHDLRQRLVAGPANLQVDDASAEP